MEVAPALLSLELPVTGNLEALEVLPTAEELRALLHRAVDVASTLAARRPGVTNLEKMACRIRSDLDFVRRCCDPSAPASAAQADDAPAAPSQPPPFSAAPHVNACRTSGDREAGGAGGGTGGGDAGGGGAICRTGGVVEGEGGAGGAQGGDRGGEGGGDAGDGDVVCRTGGGGGKGSRPLVLALTLVRVQGIINNLRGFQRPFEAEEAAGREREAEAGVVEAAAAGPGAVEAAAGGGPAATGSCPVGVDAAGAAGTWLPGGGSAIVNSTHAAAAAAVAAPADAVAAGPGCSGGVKGGGGGKGGGAAGGGAGKRGGGKGGGGGGKGGGGGGAAAAAGVAVGVEVDVVAQGGHCWIEVKNQEVFGLESVHWTGTPRVKGLKRQAEELLAVAAAPQHQRRWRAPSVVLFFPGGVHPGVRQELTAMGVHVALSPDSLRCLPPPPPPPAVTNLDVTAMCALVSDLSHGGAEDAGVERWAQRTVHWVECLAAERAAPLMAELAPWMALERPVLAADLARRQFQVLLDMFGGPRERARWASLQQRMTVVATQDQPTELSERVRAQLRDCLGADQLAVFGLGDARRAVTLTANGNAVRSAERQGVVLEVVLHRPVWLAGK
ncbi:hypothetical protein TSOC_003655 [Tetrabaena socialis]|uniref:DUF1308 domain-containing protein n=1 Tax=Tetrabaena socialis TaxID=47790 RepID=A0A2J8AAV5_9CHLO|nr:hypothetical protein TSOC_003655 [Tetrabaena socialis]|eukprot:PNH09654.1 hypothetical protein TSOC_003655 [Tetrabaena socialis]